MSKTIAFLTKRTKVDKQIDEMQLSVVSELDKISRLQNQVLKIIDNAKEITKEELVSIHNNIQHANFITKNLASDLRKDARL